MVNKNTQSYLFVSMAKKKIQNFDTKDVQEILTVYSFDLILFNNDTTFV